MNWKYIILILGLFLATLIPIGYKTYVLKMDLFPKIKKDAWEIEFALRLKGGDEKHAVAFPVPEASKRLIIHETQFEGQSVALTLQKSSNGTFAHIKGQTDHDVNVRYKVVVQSRPESVAYPSTDRSTQYPAKIEAFLQVPTLSEKGEAALHQLESELLPATRNKVNIAKTYYYYVQEEIVGTPHPQGLEKTLLYATGSIRDRSRLLTLLLRRQGIPARTVRGLRIVERDNNRHGFTTWNEVYLGKMWVPVLPTQGHFGELPTAFIPLYSSLTIDEPLEIERARFEMNVRRLLSDQFNALQYKKELAARGSLYMSFSPYMLPIKDQAALKLLLLFTVGCVALAFCRTILGVKTFGTFFPILLALFFKESSVVFGVGFLCFVVMLGYLERRFMQRMYLLSVPRFSIILTFIVMTLLAFAVLNYRYHFSSHNPTLLPIIITTMFIERFSVKMEEEGWKNTGIALLGTFFVAYVSYGLFCWKNLERLIYTHPETLFSIVAILILIGKYTGFRVSELFRFRELTRKRKSYVSTT